MLVRPHDPDSRDIGEMSRKYLIMRVPDGVQFPAGMDEYAEKTTVEQLSRTMRYPNMWYYVGCMGMWDSDEVFLADDMELVDGQSVVLIGIMEMI